MLWWYLRYLMMHGNRIILQHSIYKCILVQKQSLKETLKVCELASGSDYFKTGFQKDQSTVWDLSRTVPWCPRFIRSRPWNRIWVQVIYLGQNSRKQWQNGKWDRERKIVNKGQLTITGKQRAITQKNLLSWRARVPPSSPLRGEGAKIFTN